MTHPAPLALEDAPFRRLPGDGPSPACAYWLRSADGLRLRAGHWPAAEAVSGRGTVLLFTGRTEYLEKYAQAGADLAAAGYHVLGLDWRGQGLSDRLLADPRPGHIDDFAAYQRDVAALAGAARALDLPRPWHLLAHSMGGAIALAALTEDRAGLEIARAAFSAPMWGINVAPFPPPVAQAVTGAALRLGGQGRPAIGTGGRGTWVLDAPFRKNLLTGDGIAWGRLVAEAQAWPDLTLGGASWGWVSRALAECARLAALPSPPQPMLVTLGSREQVVSPAAIRERAARWPGARLIELPDGHHEALFETPAIRRAALDAILTHFAG